MKKNTMKKVTGGLMSVAALTSGVTPVMADEAALTAEYHSGAFHVEATVKQTEALVEVSEVKGEFGFSQNTITPSDEIFNVFGTAITGLCAKPWFAFEEGNELVGDYYINVSGDMKRSYSVSLSDLKKTDHRTEMMKCSCATSTAIAQTYVTGIPMESILSLAELDEGVNTVTLTGSDGYSTVLPLSCVLNNNAMLVYQVGDKAFAGGNNQFWMPKAAANYFTRNVVDIKVSREAEAPQLNGVDDDMRAKVCIMNKGGSAALGSTLCFEGYADDCGTPIAAVEFSLDGGKNWTAYETADASADRWVYWNFQYQPEQTGSYELTVRARTADGTVSPLASSVNFVIE